MKSPSAALLDAGAVALSSLCLLHCLALPLLAAALPLFGTWAEAEWVHLLFVAIALPLTGYALWRAERRHPLPVLAWATAGGGLGLLLAGALALPLHEWGNADDGHRQPAAGRNAYLERAAPARRVESTVSRLSREARDLMPPGRRAVD